MCYNKITNDVESTYSSLVGAEAVDNAPEKQNWFWHGDFLEGEDVIEARVGLAGHSDTLPQLAKLSIHYQKS
jgi:hypothetical protein